MKKGAWLVLSRDMFFERKIRLLCERCGVIALTQPTADGNIPLLGCVHDIDTAADVTPPQEVATVLRFSRRNAESSYPIPTPIGLIERLLTAERVGLALEGASRTVTIGTRRIALTEMEYALLARLLAEEGRAVSQEELLRDVWQGEAGVGTVTVYIHYLRQKLEAEGERVLRIKRGCGYYIDEKYAKGAILC